MKSKRKTYKNFKIRIDKNDDYISVCTKYFILDYNIYSKTISWSSLEDYDWMPFEEFDALYTVLKEEINENNC